MKKLNFFNMNMPNIRNLHENHFLTLHFDHGFELLAGLTLLHWREFGCFWENFWLFSVNTTFKRSVTLKKQLTFFIKRVQNFWRFQIAIYYRFLSNHCSETTKNMNTEAAAQLLAVLEKTISAGKLPMTSFKILGAIFNI